MLVQTLPTTVCLHYTLLCTLPIYIQVPPELSIVPLDSTLSHFEALPLDLPLSSSPAALTDLASLQAGLSNFHDSVCAMVQQHVTNNTQVCTCKYRCSTYAYSVKLTYCTNLIQCMEKKNFNFEERALFLVKIVNHFIYTHYENS